MELWIFSCILITAIVLFIWEKLPLDLVSLGILTTLLASGILSPAEALAGFSNASVVTIAAMFMVSRGLVRTGALGFASEKLIRYSRGDEKRILVLSMLLTAAASAFVNNTPVVILMISILMSICCEYGLSPSKFLIPISYSSIAGGMSTLIGTSTNLIVSELSRQSGAGPLGMFELAPVGIPVLMAALAFLYFAAPRLLPSHKSPVCELTGKRAPHYLAEFRVPARSRLVGKDATAFLKTKYPTFELFEVVRDDAIQWPERERIIIEAKDLLLVKGSANELVSILKTGLVELPDGMDPFQLNSLQETSMIVELVIAPQSALTDESPLRSILLRQLNIQVIAVKRRRIHYSEQKIRNLRLAVGDILLTRCSRDALDQLRTQGDTIILEDIHHQMIDPRKAPLAAGIALGMVAVASFQVVDVAVAALAAAFLMVVSGCLQLKDAYRAIDVKVLLLIVSTLALGAAMEKTGAAELYAGKLIEMLHGLSPVLVLTAFILLTCFLTELMSNSATAVLLFPIAISTATALGVNPKPFIIAVCLGASSGFAVPIGYQTHMLIYGPGGYRFTDFLRLGIPMDLMTCSISSLLIPVFWPLA